MPGFSPNVMGNMASMDQRTADVLRNDINRSENKLVDVENKLKVRTEAQLMGDKDRIKTIKLNKLVKNFTEERQEDDPDFVFSGLGKPKRTPEAWRQAFDDLKAKRARETETDYFGDVDNDEPIIKEKVIRKKKKIIRLPIAKIKTSLANVESSSIDRDVTGEPNIVNVSPSIVNMEDNIDVVSSTFEPIEDEVKDDIESEDITNENIVSEVLNNDDNNNDVSSDDLANLVNDQLTHCGPRLLFFLATCGQILGLILFHEENRHKYLYFSI